MSDQTDGLFWFKNVWLCSVPQPCNFYFETWFEFREMSLSPGASMFAQGYSFSRWILFSGERGRIGCGSHFWIYFVQTLVFWKINQLSASKSSVLLSGCHVAASRISHSYACHSLLKWGNTMMSFAFQSLQMCDSKALIFNWILSLVLQCCLCFGVLWFLSTLGFCCYHGHLQDEAVVVWFYTTLATASSSLIS